MIRQRIFIIISIFIVTTDLTFVWLNHQANQKDFEREITRKGEMAFASFDRYLDNTYKSMLKLAHFVANDQMVKQKFVAGRQAFLEDDDKEAAQQRNDLYSYLSDSWHALQKRYFVRQLHFHIGPGDYSFLRVHKPSKFGDDLSSIRHTIVDSIQNNQEVTGFESGRVYSGLRGVVPITDNSGKPIGALEAGSSFNDIIQDLNKSLSSEFAILLDTDYMKETMWQERLYNFYRKNPPVNNLYVESATSNFVKDILRHESLNKLRPQLQHHHLEMFDQHFVVYSKPLYSYQKLRDNDPKPVGYIFSWEDITPLVTLQQEALMHNILFALIALIIIELALFNGLKITTERFEKAIKNANQDLQIKNKRLENFGRTLSHDLKVPLSAITGYADYNLTLLSTIDSSPAQKEMHESLHNIKQAGLQMDALITNLLQYAHAGISDKADITVTELVQKAQKNITETIEKSNLTVDLQQKEIKVYVNEFLFTQVFVNLLANSVKYKNPDLDPKVSIRVTTQPDHRIIYYQDNGVGIHKDDLPNIFKKGYRARNISSKIEGFGIGLHTAQKIVEDHSGEITATSTEGEGTLFTITLPLKGKNH